MDDGGANGEGDNNVKRTTTTTQMKEKETDDREFPDEVETPIDIPASKRFARYRSLQNMRNAEWNPKESLPVDYGRIFQVCEIEELSLYCISGSFYISSHSSCCLLVHRVFT